jgi:hypothetical protein
MLPALSGIAGQMQLPMTGMHLAGLWYKDGKELAAQLLWKSATVVPEACRPNPPVAPTFSWASCVGAVTFFHKNHLHKAQITILEAECTLKGLGEAKDLYGQASSGFLKIRGRLTTATFHPSKCGKCRTQYGKTWNPTVMS